MDGRADKMTTETSPLIRDDAPTVKIFDDKIEQPQVTVRATVAGLVIGMVVLISNFQFGLQTGWVSMMSLPSALLGFAIFNVMPVSKRFTDVENVYIQSLAVAVGTGPLAFGLIGIIPAIEKFVTPLETGLDRKIHFGLWELIVWSLGLALFGVFFAVPLRKQVIIKEKLPFPSGSATATLISVLHNTKLKEFEDENEVNVQDFDNQEPELIAASSSDNAQTKLAGRDSYDTKIKSLLITFSVSAFYTLSSYFFPSLRHFPVFGSYLAREYKWDFQPSPAYVGQGIIMGLPTVSYMLFGAVFGWGILAPLVKHLGWAPGEIDNWIDGAQGWILWLSLSVMISDSLVSFVVVSIKSINSRLQKYRDSEMRITSSALVGSSHDPDNGDVDEHNISSEGQDVPTSHLISDTVTSSGIILSSILCVIALKIVFKDLIPIYSSVFAIILALLFSVLGVRALGETDLNPVSGIGKLSQLVFALLVPSSHPARILINIVAGGIAEAGAQQAGDLMQDLKTGHLVGASPKAQFIAQLIGTLFSVVFSSVIYKVYNSVYEIPSDTFRIPTAMIWVDCARLVTGEGLPPNAFQFSIIFGCIFGAISLLKNTLPRTNSYHKYLVYIPNGVAVGIGIYNSPNFTLARFLGGAMSYWWINYKGKDSKDSKVGMIIFSSGLVLGEGLMSGFNMLLASLGVKHL